MPEPIAQLSAAMAVGDAEAVDAFYREYFDWMYGQARRVTHRDESFCLDVVQDAVLRVIRTVKPVAEEGRFRGWLQLVVKTTAFDLLRSERRRKNREAMAGVVATTVEPDADSLQLDWLADQITRLDPEIVKIIELRFEQRWSLRRIGQRLGVSIGAVDGRLRRALTHLRLAAEELPASLVQQGATKTEPALATTTTSVDPPVEESSTVMVIAPDASLADNVDVVAAPAPTVDPLLVDAAEVTAVVEQADAVMHAEPRDHEESVPLPVAEADPVRIEPGIVEPEAAARAVAEARSDHLVVVQPVEEPQAIGVMDSPELAGLEDEAGWYDDVL